MDNNFSEDDKKKLIEFLNITAEKGSFNLSYSEVIKYYGLIAFMQKELIPKINANILEIVQVIEPEKKPAKKGKK